MRIASVAVAASADLCVCVCGGGGGYFPHNQETQIIVCALLLFKQQDGTYRAISLDPPPPRETSSKRQCLTLCSTLAPGSVTSATGRTTTRGTPRTAAREGGETISAKREEETEEGAKSDQKKEINSSGAIPKRVLSTCRL